MRADPAVLGLLLQNNPNMRIIIAGTENITMNLYNGNQRSMLITNCIFRLGGVALLLSNHPADRFRAKYKLKHMVRTHLGSVDEAYKCAPATPSVHVCCQCHVGVLCDSTPLALVRVRVSGHAYILHVEYH